MLMIEPLHSAEADQGQRYPSRQAVLAAMLGGGGPGDVPKHVRPPNKLLVIGKWVDPKEAQRTFPDFKVIRSGHEQALYGHRFDIIVLADNGECRSGNGRFLEIAYSRLAQGGRVMNLV